MGSLLKRGVDLATAKDACQEVAVRLLTAHAEFDSAEHFYRWLNRVGHNVVSKWQRKDRRISSEAVPDRLVTDAAMTVESRVALEATVVAFTSLSENDRQALTTALRDDPRGATRRERDRVSLQVHRARKRLRERLEGWWAGLPPWRWLTDSPQLATAPQLAVGVLAVTLAVVPGWLAPESQTSTRPTVERISRTRDTSDAAVLASVEAFTAATSARQRTQIRRNRAEDREDRTPSQQAGPLDTRVEVTPPAEAPGTTETEVRPRHPKDNALLCWGNWIILPDGCIQHPLRR